MSTAPRIPRRRDELLMLWLEMPSAIRVALGVVGGILAIALIAHGVAR
jgi:hypothetical protein